MAAGDGAHVLSRPDLGARHLPEPAVGSTVIDKQTVEKKCWAASTVIGCFSSCAVLGPMLAVLAIVTFAVR
jgi:hypothetical protein